MNRSEYDTVRTLDDDPIFILCHARSGSTLLRYCLDSHDEIACPPETNLAITFSAIQKTSIATLTGSYEDKLAKADEICRQVADRTVGEFMRGEGKRRWCDKSLSSISMAPLLQQIYPAAKFLCLFRECADVVISAMDASRWGFRGYGLEEYAQGQSDNHVMTLVRFWVENTSQLYKFWEGHPKNAYSLRYEDLVTEPERTLKGVFEFLGYTWNPDYADADHIFGKRHAKGHGDYKIGALSTFQPDIGRGWKVPRSMIPPGLLEQANQLLESLGYPRLDEIHAIRPANNVDIPSEARSTLISHFRFVFAGPMDKWSHGVGEYVIVNTAEVVRVDIENRTVEMHVPSPDDDEILGYQVVTDSLTLLSILHGVNMSVAINEGQLVVNPYPSIAVDDRAQFYDDLSSLFRNAHNA